MCNKRGFTLIELIVSISLILILFIVVVPLGTNLIQNANKKQCNTLVEDILTDADLYVLDRPDFNDTSIPLLTLYDEGYLEEEYDFKNGYVLESGELKYEGVVKNAQINIDNSDGYNNYELSVDVCN
ncbi:MAG: prepilin-type N-terminal cleavage/methylation domain-containing protein [Firmicutes bacterium]|nr:prepilin-type N-terminal cleavage/methylation domain-containing protein [Bacillota bacterium]